MSDDLDGRLRAALRPVDPGERFTASVLSHIAAEQARETRRAPTRTLRWVYAGLAATLIVSVLVTNEWQTRRTQRGLEARRQLLEALRVASDQLDIAYRAVNDQDVPHSTVDENRGT